MQFGHFDDARREYVITRADTPRPWSNYLGSTTYGAIITNHAGGYSFYRSAARGRFVRFRGNSVPLDQPGRYFYLRDRETGDYWSSSWQPVGKPLDQFEYECRHGTAYTTITAKYSGIRSESTYFVPLGRSFECWLLKVENTSDRPRQISVFTYVELASDWTGFHDLINLQYSQYVIKSDYTAGLINTGFLRHIKSDLEHVETQDQGRQSFFTLVGADIAGFDTRREVFLGNYRDYENPIVVERGECTGSLAHGDNACATLQVNLTLAPGESRELLVLMGVGSVANWGEKVRAEFDVPRAHQELEKLKHYWHERLGRFTVHSPDPEFDSTVNVWGAYNALITYAWSRAASLVYQGERDGLGYRDTVQDLLGVVGLIPEEARERLELMLTGQVSTGGAISVIKPFSHQPGKESAPKHYRSDDCLWLFNTVPAYVKETGDLGFFDKVLPYGDSGQATVLEHLRRALEFNLERTGTHGLPAGLDADWNDCLNLGERGESVFVTFQVRFGLVEYEQIADLLGRESEARWAREQRAALDIKIRELCWDGAWFARGFRADGSVIGTHRAEEGKIFLEPQPWAVISGAASREQGVGAMDSVYRELSTEYGIMICAPPFRKDQTVGACIFNAGQKENAGIFCHPQGWAVIAEAMLGRGARAHEFFRNYLPAAYNARAEIREIEPYVYSQSTHGKFSRMFGASRLPWLSGTAAWSYHAATHYLCGVRPEYRGITIDPALPTSWKTLEIERNFRGKLLKIRIDNSRGVEKGVSHLVVNGERIAGNFVPEAKLREDSEVTVVMGV
ncbi:MAG TPA: hypothetical protein VGP93_04280 [Polyangiaceae bacterium]|nr:hypothetical protein [Polyangiaceae bacterium]